jgi:hypothetical protein
MDENWLVESFDVAVQKPMKIMLTSTNQAMITSNVMVCRLNKLI